MLLEKTQDITDLFVISKDKISGIKSTYEIIIKCDFNDADYISDTIRRSEKNFKEDLLFQYVISYVGKGYQGKFGSEWNDGIYGHHLMENKQFPWLEEYCESEGLLLSGPYGDNCHSITKISIVYYDSNGDGHEVSIPDFDKLFDKLEDAQKIMNELYKEYDS